MLSRQNLQYLEESKISRGSVEHWKAVSYYQYLHLWVRYFFDWCMRRLLFILRLVGRFGKICGNFAKYKINYEYCAVSQSSESVFPAVVDQEKREGIFD